MTAKRSEEQTWGRSISERQIVVVTAQLHRREFRACLHIVNSAGTNSKFSIGSVIEVPAIAVFTATTPTTTA
jgi:hypothetical protein